jgi:hypothetical protein
MGEYLVLIYREEAGVANLDPEENERIMAEFRDFGARNAASIIANNALQPASTATSVRKDAGGGFTVTDGAFAETKEALGGYFLIEVANLDEALEIAKQVPVPSRGGVEIRPIRTFD